MKESLKIKRSEYIYREYNDIYSKSEVINNDEDIEKLMKIDVFRNELDTYFEFERNKYGVDENDNIVTPNTSWFVLKPSMTDDKMNKYKLSQGEIVKLGRITMRVRDIIFEGKNKYNLNENSILNNSIDSKNNNINEMQTLKTEGNGIHSILSIKAKTKIRNKKFNFDKLDTNIDKKEKINIIKKSELKKNSSLFSKIEKLNKICRICYIQEEDEINNPLVQPCNCDGSMKYIHLQCLSHWIQTHSCEKLETNNKCSIYLIKPIECELCKTRFPDFIKYKNKIFPLINFSNEFKSYLTFESLTFDKYHNKFIYVVSLENPRKITIGKNHGCEIVLSDRSIENLHCFMVVRNNQVYLEDNDSKFGTLVLVQTKRIKLYQDIPLYLQIGRSFLEIIIKKDFKLFDCCVSDDKNNVYTYYEQNEKYIKKDMALVIKNEDEQSESFIKNNNTQEVKLYDFGNSSSIDHKDKISDNEYLLIKRSKRNKDIIKNMFNEITTEEKKGDYNEKADLDEKEKIIEEKSVQKSNIEDKQIKEPSEEIKLESESESIVIDNKDKNEEEKKENIDENNIEEDKKESKSLIDNNNNNEEEEEKNLIEDIKSLKEEQKSEIINNIENNPNIESDINNNI